MTDAERIKDLELRLARVCDGLAFLLFCAYQIAEGHAEYLLRLQDEHDLLVKYCNGELV